MKCKKCNAPMWFFERLSDKWGYTKDSTQYAGGCYVCRRCGKIELSEADKRWVQSKEKRQWLLDWYGDKMKEEEY